MPNPMKSCPGLEEIFVNNIYKNTEKPWDMTAAISRAHTIGSAKVENSGFSGFWSDPARSGVFNNDYYRSLVMKGWGPEIAVAGNK